MNRTGRALTLSCLLLLQPLLALAEGGNSLLIPATGRCTFDTQPEDLQNALKACERTAESGDAQAQYELGEFYYSGNQAPKDLKKAVNWFEKASLQGQAQAQYRHLDGHCSLLALSRASVRNKYTYVVTNCK